MPIYEYECTKCARVFEKIQRHSEPPLETCDECGGPVRRLVSSPAIQFKGEGWYVTDYAGKGKEARERAKAEKSPDGSEGGKKSSEPKGSKAGKEPSGT